MNYRVELHEKAFVENQGWSYDTVISNSLTNFIDNLRTIDFINEDFFFQSDSETDYLYYLSVYDRDGNEIKTDIDPVWGSELMEENK